MHDPVIESRIETIGREIFARVRDESVVLPSEWLDGVLMGWMMRDEQVKGQLFRFVDVLPALAGAGQIAGHLREYLGTTSGWVGSMARAIPVRGLSGAAVAGVAGFNTRRMARRFIAATDLEDAVRAITRLRNKGLAFTLDVLGEAVVSEREAGDYQRKYLELIEGLSARLGKVEFDEKLDSDGLHVIPRVNLSLKLSALYSQFDPLDLEGTTRGVAERLRPILLAAKKTGTFINIDMEQFAFKDATQHIFKTVLGENEFCDWPDVGIAMQAYLQSTEGDLKELCDWGRQRGAPVWVRLVKGAYWDFERVIAAQNDWPAPVFVDKARTDASFETCARFLIENHQFLRPAIASHNVRSIAAAMAFAERAGLGAGELEFQMLYGMAEPVKAALVAMGRRVRVYAPMGRLLPGMAYLVRRLLENTSNESFLRASSTGSPRAGFLEHVPEEVLLMNPAMKIRDVSVSKPSAEFSNEPWTDFSMEGSRSAMGAALAGVKARLGREYPLVIGGQRVTSGQWIESIDPSHKTRLVGKCAAATIQDAQQAIAAAKAALPGWRNTPAGERAALLDRAGEVLSRRRLALAAWEVFECGKPWREADADVAEAIDFCRYYAWQMRELAKPGGADVPGETNRWIYDARGVAVVISPWNFPLAILCGMTAAAVVAGNPVVMKPAEQSSVIAAKLMDAFEEAGAPAGVVNYLPGVGEEIGPVLVDHPDVAMIAFTGSRPVGLGINYSASKTPVGQDHVKRIITEMGGKNAIIVDDDADLDEAVSGVVASAFGYAGQKCSACSRVIVLAKIHDAFLGRLIEATRSLRIAPAEDPACKVGPVIDEEAYRRILKEIERAKAEARLVLGGDVGEFADQGYYIGPHIFADVPSDSRLAREEIFGPVLAVMKAGDLSAAIELANGVDYALTGGVYSRSPGNIQRCEREFRVGNLYINRKITGALVGWQPFGGFKLSGAGTQAGGPDYLRHFLLPRCVTENTLRHGFAPGEEG